MDKTVVFIPVRGGSKSIPMKNIKNLCGKPLVYWVSKAACEAVGVDRVFIATDSRDIREAVEDYCEKEKEVFKKITVIDRLAENAEDTSSTESVMLEFANRYEFEDIILAQATSPLLQGSDIDGGLSVYRTSGTDSVISLVKQKRFLWSADGENVSADNYDIYNRPRRQDFDGYFMENGAFYITSRKALLQSGNRISGNVKAYIMPEDTAIEIDEKNDFALIEVLLRKRLKEKRCCNKRIRMVAMDCDGCLTDGGMYYSENGDELKKYNTKDGMAIAKINDNGIITGIITGEDKSINKRRADKLHMNFIRQGVKDKLSELKSLCCEYDILPEEVLYIGDDINDIFAMEYAGISACPGDAAEKVKDIADYVSEKKGGEGAVRDILEEFCKVHE